MPGRSYLSSTGYRYGFGGQEMDNDVSGNGNSYTAEFWQYDPRLGRRWNIDPMAFDYPEQSPYSAFNNNPNIFNDPNGLEGEKKGDTFVGDDGKTYSTSIDAPEVIAEGPKIAANNVGGHNVEIEGADILKGSQTFTFGKNGMPYNPYQTPENYDFWKNNKEKFQNDDGSTAAFSDIFTSDGEFIGDMLEEDILKWAGALGADIGDDPSEILGYTGTIKPSDKYEKFRYNFPTSDKKEALIRVARDKEITEMRDLERLSGHSSFGSEMQGRLNYLERKYPDQMLKKKEEVDLNHY